MQNKVIPTKDMDEATLEAYRQAEGIPDSPEGYDFKPPPLPEGVEYDDSGDKWFANIAKEYNVSKDVANAIRNEFIQREIENGKLRMQQKADEQGRFLAENEVYLKEKYQDKYHHVLAGAKRFADTWGITEMIEGTPLANNAKFLERLYEGSLTLGEDRLIEAGRGGTTTESQKNVLIQEIIEHPAYANAKDPLHKQKVREFNKIMFG
jgi:hypothetical protein